MRDARPRHTQPIVIVDRIPVECLQHIEINRAQRFGRDGSAFFDQSMCLQLEVRKHDLCVERRHDAVDRMLQEDDPLPLIGGAAEHVVEEQRLAERRRHLGDEDRVAGVHERLMRVGQKGVHRMTHFVGQREHGVERVVVVEQHVRMHAVHRGGVRAAPFARILVDVDPVAGQHLPELPLVGRTQRGDRRGQPFQHVLVRVPAVELHERDAGIVRVIRRQAEHALAETMVTAQGLGSLPGGLDQVLDDGRRNIVAVEGHLEHRAVPSCLRDEPVALQHTVVERGVGIGGTLVQLMKLVERRSAVWLASIGRQNGAVLSVRQRRVGSARQADLGKLRVCRRQRGVGVVGSTLEAARQRQQMLALVVEHVLLLPIQILHGKPIDGEVGARVHPLLHDGQRNLQQLGIEPGSRLGRLREQNLDLLPLRVDLVVALILVVPERREVPDLVLELADVVAQLQRRQQLIRSAAEGALEGRKLRDLRLELVVRRLPGRPVREDMSEIPFETRRDLVAFAERRRRGRFGGRRLEHPRIILHAARPTSRRDRRLRLLLASSQRKASSLPRTARRRGEMMVERAR